MTCLKDDIITLAVSGVNQEFYVLVITVKSVNDMSENILMIQIEQFMQEFTCKHKILP